MSSPRGDASALSAEQRAGNFYAMSHPSGRRIEFTLRGRCAPNDPILVLAHGMLYNLTKLLFGEDFLLEMAGLGWTLSKEELRSLPFTIVQMVRGGYGGSGTQQLLGSGYAAYVEDLLAVVDEAASLVQYRGPRAEETSVPFCIIGVSSGGPCALAACARVPGRVTGCVLLSGDANYAERGDPGFNPSKAAAAEYAKLSSRVRSREDLEALESMGGEVFFRDGSWLLRKSAPLGFLFATSWNLCCCACPRGFKHDLDIEVRTWDFDLGQVRCPLWIYASAADRTVDPNCSRYLAARVKHSSLTVLDGSHHPVKLPRDMFETMLGDLRSAAMITPDTRK